MLSSTHKRYPVVIPADSEEPTDGLTPRLDYPAAKLSDSPSLPNTESTESESPSTVQKMNKQDTP